MKRWPHGLASMACEDHQEIRHNEKMKSYISAAVLLLVLNCTATTIEGRVMGVLDGDTISLLDQHHKQFRIRLSGIDAREKATIWAAFQGITEQLSFRKSRNRWNEQARPVRAQHRKGAGGWARCQSRTDQSRNGVALQGL